MDKYPQGENQMFTVPKLSFAFDALEPNLSQDVIYYHYTKHTKKYFDVTNELIKGTRWEDFTNLDDLITSKSLKNGTHLYSNAMQAYNHQLYWENLAPTKESGKPNKELMTLITNQWKDFATFKKEFEEAGVGGFGSTWCWLILNKDELEIVVTQNADNPVYSKQGKVLLVVDGWEHSYYLSYQNNKAAYFKAVWNIINWNTVNDRYNRK
jgi:Fe-Mn family superoxide dismutase